MGVSRSSPVGGAGDPGFFAVVGEWALSWVSVFFPPLAGVFNFFVEWVVYPLYSVIFWRVKQATPGKMALAIKVADAKTGNAPGVMQCVVRYFAYYVSAIPFFLGFLWAAADKKNQGWHDKLAGTVVIMDLPNPPKAATENTPSA